jgi:hypothetical protein
MKRLLVGFVALAMSGATTLAGQSSRWTFTTDFQAGLYVPTRDIGTSGVARARMRQAPVVAGFLRLSDAGSPIGLYVATTQALQGGLRAWPTAACQLNCQAQTGDYGRFWTLTAGVTLGGNIGSTQIVGNIGGGFRTYAGSGGDFTQNVPQPGEFGAGGFRGPSTNPALHLGVLAGRRIGGYVLFLRIEDFVAGSSQIPGRSDDRRFNDLTISVGGHLPWPSRRD